MKEKIFQYIIDHKKPILIVYIVVTILSVIALFFVDVNYSMVDYLPDDSPSTEAIELMDEEFPEEDNQFRIMVENISISEALSQKEDLADVNRVIEVDWLDDEEDLEQPLSQMNQDTVENYYVDENALFIVSVDVDEDEVDERDEVIEDLRAVMGEDGIMSGELLLDYERDQNTVTDLGWSISVSVLIAIIVLSISTTTWIASFLILGVIGAAIAINMGTNIFLGEISFVTRDAAAILQLAVSIDFSLFLFHRYEEMRKEEDDKEKAMKQAMIGSFNPVFSSGLTEIFGFGALITMEYGIGQDMGIVLAKGVLLSLISVFLLLPSVTLLSDSIVEKTTHKSFVPSLKPIAKGIFKVRYISIAVLIVIVIPMFLANEENDFYYGEPQGLPDDNYVMIEEEEIESHFGRDNMMSLMIPTDLEAQEGEIVNRLEDLSFVSTIEGFVEESNYSIPINFLPESEQEEFQSEDYSRMVIYTELPEEGDITFAAIETIQEEIEEAFGRDYYLAGESPSTYDLKQVITEDQQIVNIVSVVSIFLVLLFVFRSLSLPVFLVFCIQSAIFINLGVPYFTGQTLYYIGYLILHSIQLGSTVDYATLIADRYLEEREVKDKLPALMDSIQKAGVSILTSGIIMISSSFMFGFFSTSEVTSQIGFLLSRGAALSLIIVLLVLPTLLYLFDGSIEKTTWKADFK